MDPITRSGQRTQELHYPLPATRRIGRHHRHGILCRITIAKPCPPTYLDKGGEPGKHYIDLRLIQRPCIDHGIDALLGAADHEPFLLIAPEICQRFICLIQCPGILVFFFDSCSLPGSSLAQKKYQSGLLSRSQADTLLQGCTVVSSQFLG